MKIKNLLFLSAFLFASCTSTKGFKGRADFCGILTDSQNHGLSGYTVCINGNKKCVTNDSGVFVFADIKSQNITVSGYKNGYEKIACETYFYDENNFFCFTVKTKEEVIKEIEFCLEEKEYSKAEELIDSIDYSNDDEKIEFLRSIVSYLKNENQKAGRAISKIKYSDEYIERYKLILKNKRGKR